MAAAPETPAPAPAPAPVPADPLTAYYRSVRQGSLQLAKERYKGFYKGRTQEFIRGRGTVAVVEDDICMGCTHCFDNCAFEAIAMADRRFALPDYSYTSRKAVIVYDNCVGCEKCAIVCPVDAITMVPKHGFEIRDGKMVQLSPPLAPSAAPPPASAPAAIPPVPKPEGA